MIHDELRGNPWNDSQVTVIFLVRSGIGEGFSSNVAFINEGVIR
jgi:hypothetical protein